MSLQDIYKKAGVVMKPAAMKNGKLYSQQPHSGAGDFNFSRADGVQTRINKHGLIETVANNEPRLSYDIVDGKVSDCPHLLLEPSRTNSIPYSNDFTNAAWTTASSGTGSSATVTGNYAASPDGSQNASRLQISKGSGTTSSDFSTFEDAFSTISTASLSIWMKSNDSNNYSVALRSSNYVVCSVTPEWQRFELNNQSNVVLFQLILRGGYGTSDSADILIYGSQAENGSYATSYIPTSGSTEQRQSDICNGSGNSETFNTSEGVLFVESAALADDLTFRQITLNDSGLNTILIGYRTNSNRIYAQLVSDNVSQAFLNYDVADITEFHKVALKYSINSVHLWIDGVKRASDISATMPLALTNLDLQSTTGGAQFNAKVKQLIYFNEALTDEQLQLLTTP